MANSMRFRLRALRMESDQAYTHCMAKSQGLRLNSEARPMSVHCRLSSKAPATGSRTRTRASAAAKAEAGGAWRRGRDTRAALTEVRLPKLKLLRPSVATIRRWI